MKRVVVIGLLLAVSCPVSGEDALARGRRLSAPDCMDASRLVSQSDANPSNVTFMRVQHIGDAGTEEQALQGAHVVTWDVGALTGLHAPPTAQRGYRDEGLPVGTSAFQLACEDAGFLINSWQFKHSRPLVGEGPSVTIGRSFDPPLPFGDGLVMSMDARVPWILNQRPPTSDGTAQLSFLYYLRDRRSGLYFAHLVGIYENRPPGVGGSGVESFGDDGITAFASSPLLSVDAVGAPVEFVSPPAGEEMQFVTPWSELRHFKATVTEGNLRRLLARLRAIRPVFSADPTDYEVVLFAVLAEVFPGTGNQDNVSFGGSIHQLTLDGFRYARSAR